MPLYDVSHDTLYRYDTPVTLSQHIAHLRPREVPHQHCLSHTVQILPAAVQHDERTDFFGNPAMRFAVYVPHERLLVRAESRIRVDALAWPVPAASPPWEAVRDRLRDGLSGHAPLQSAAREAGQYRFASPFVALGDESAAYAAYAAQDFTPGRPIVEAVLALSARIHADFDFDPVATSVATPVAEVFAERRGVCQDFSHFLIACLRTLGLAARYVSGYLLTAPPPGQPRLIGADASHAWTAVWCGEPGWVEVDPTNDMQPGDGHITLAWGRDYGDVCPLRGVIMGGGEHSVEVAVTVMPVAEAGVTA